MESRRIAKNNQTRSTMKTSQSYVKSIKVRFKEITHDKVWDSDEEKDESVSFSDSKHHNIQRDDCPVVTQSDVTVNRSAGDDLINYEPAARPKLQRQLSYAPECDETSDYESEYHTSKENLLSDNGEKRSFASARYFQSVPDLHSKELLKGEEDSFKPKVLSIINVSHSREFIISPNEGMAMMKKTTNNILTGNKEEHRQLNDRTLNMLKMFDSTHPKVETELYKVGLSYIRRDTHFPLVIFKGSRSGCGFAAKMLFKKVISIKPNLKSVYLKEAKELNTLNWGEDVAVLVIDANGSSGDNKAKLDDWYEILKEKMPIGAKERGNITLILTINTCSAVKHSILARYREYVLNADEFRPSDETKEKLVHAILRQNNVRVISSRHGPIPPPRPKKGKIHFINIDTVNRIVPFLDSKGCIGEISDYIKGHLSEELDFFRKPVPKLVQKFRQLYKKSKLLFLSLLVVHTIGHVSHKNSFHEAERLWRSVISTDKLSRKAYEALEKEHKLDMEFHHQCAKESGNQCNIGKAIRKAVLGYVGEYLEKECNIFKFSNGRIYYSFLLVLYEAYPKGLETCDEDFLYNFVKLRTAIDDEDQDTYIAIDEKKLDKVTRSVCCRFKKEIMLKNVAKCMKHPVMSPTFFKIFLRYLSETPHMTWKVLKQSDSSQEEAYSSLYHGMTHLDENDSDSGKANITEIILCTDIWKRKRRSKKWKEWIADQERIALVYASELSNTATFRCLVDVGAEISLQALQKAIDNGSEEILQTIIKSRQIATVEAAKYAALKLCHENLTPGFEKLLKDFLCTYSMNQPPLIHLIIKINNTQLLTKLLSGELVGTIVDVNLLFNGETPLLVAVKFGFQEIVRLLLQHKATLGQKEFAVASSKGDVSTLEILYEWRPSTFYEEDAIGWTPLFYAASYGQLEAVKFILLTSKNKRQPRHVNSLPQDDINEGRDDFGNIDSCMLDPALQVKNLKGQTALHVAAKKGYTQIVEALVKEGFDISMKDKSGNSPLALSYRNKHFQTFRWILTFFKSKSLPVDEDVIILVLRKGETDILELMQTFCSPTNWSRSTYDIVIRESVETGMHNMVQHILSNGGSPNKEIDGQRPIHFAAINGDFDMLKILIEFGADMTAKTVKTGDSIIHIGVERGYEDFIESVFRLPESDDLIDNVNAFGNTALHVASRIGHHSLLRRLLELGFKSNIKNQNNCLPHDIVEQELKVSNFCTDTCKIKLGQECRKLLENYPR